jgi:hypothetical protein
MCTWRQHIRSNRQFVCGTWVVGRTIVVANQDRNSRWRKAKLKLKPGNARRINFGHWRIDVKPRLPKYPTCIVTMSMDPETLLRSAERKDVSTMRKLMPLGGWTGSNLIFQNSQGCYNLQNFGIGRWLWKSFLRSTEWAIHNESLWWHSHSGE